jgi:hypothetical protein
MRSTWLNTPDRAFFDFLPFPSEAADCNVGVVDIRIDGVEVDEDREWEDLRAESGLSDPLLGRCVGTGAPKAARLLHSVFSCFLGRENSECEGGGVIGGEGEDGGS